MKISHLRTYHRRQQIKHIEKQTQTYRRETQKAEQTIQMLNSKDSLERYARELYYMHNDNEDVYIVEE